MQSTDVGYNNVCCFTVVVFDAQLRFKVFETFIFALEETQYDSVIKLTTQLWIQSIDATIYNFSSYIFINSDLKYLKPTCAKFPVEGPRDLQSNNFET